MNGLFSSKYSVSYVNDVMSNGKSSIALIDDNQSVLTSIKILLELEGHQVIASTNINDLMVLVQASESVPSLVVADYRLGNNENGISAVTKIRNHANKYIPALVITGSASQKLEKLANFNGCHLMLKPVSPDSFLELVSMLLDGTVNSPISLQPNTPEIKFFNN